MSCESNTRNAIGPSNLRARWSAEEEKVLIDTLVSEVRKGKRADAGFKSVSFALVQQQVQQAGGVTYELQQIRNKYSALKKDFDVFTALKSSSGFGWSDYDQTVTAEDEVWERYLKVHPAAKKFRKETLRHYLELSELFTGIRATGENIILPSQALNSISRSSVSQLEPTGNISSRFISNPTTYDYPDCLDPALYTSNGNLVSKRVLQDDESVTIEADVMAKDESEETESTRPSHKRIKRERNGRASQVAYALFSMQKTAEKLNISKTELAIKLLMDVYARPGGLSDDELIAALSVFENLRKSEMFLALAERKIRDIWLKKQISLVCETKTT